MDWLHDPPARWVAVYRVVVLAMLILLTVVTGRNFLRVETVEKVVVAALLTPTPSP